MSLTIKYKTTSTIAVYFFSFILRKIRESPVDKTVLIKSLAELLSPNSLEQNFPECFLAVAAADNVGAQDFEINEPEILDRLFKNPVELLNLGSSQKEKMETLMNDYGDISHGSVQRLGKSFHHRLTKIADSEGSNQVVKQVATLEKNLGNLRERLQAIDILMR